VGRIVWHEYHRPHLPDRPIGFDHASDARAQVIPNGRDRRMCHRAHDDYSGHSNVSHNASVRAIIGIAERFALDMRTQVESVANLVQVASRIV